MEIWVTDRSRVMLPLVACALLSSFELLIPLFRYRAGRIRRALPNLLLSAGVLGGNLALASATAALCAIVTRWRFGMLGRAHLAPWVLLVLGVMGLDLSAYVAHILLHKVPVGWRFHRVHHSEPEVDVTTAFRQHPGETLWRFMVQCVGIVVLGLPFWVVPLYLSVSSLHALLEHANVRVAFRIDKWLRLVMVTPDMHKIHHSCVSVQTDSNYSNIFSLWDRLFGTYTKHVNVERLRYGLDGFDESQKQTAAALIVEPFRST
jgi:sterol desaturase/sphingolipid hydroxylase (fatty acid hydroxylase superfamily)